MKKKIRGALFAAVAMAALAVAAVGTLPGTSAIAAAAPTQPVASSPAPNSVLTAPPRRIVIPRSSATPGSVTLYDSHHRTLATVPARPAGGALVASLPQLPRGAGVDSVVWRAGGQSGSFAFQVEPAGASPVLVSQPQPDNSLTPVREALPEWLAFAFIFIFIGTLSLRFLVTRPTIARLGARPQLAAAVDRRLLILAGATIALFIPATLAQLVYEATDPELGLSFWQSIRPAKIWSEFLSSTPEGHLWLIRLGLTALAAIVVIPAAVTALRRGRDLSPRRIQTVAAIGLAAGIGELLARVIPTETPEEWVREIFTDLLDWGHMTGASVWIGGLVALAVLGATLRLSATESDGFWSAVLRRFSVVATVCVGVMILTGLWTAWIHVGPPRLLFHTLYGETLLVKLILVLILVGLGAVNQLWLLPRVNAIRAGGTDGSALSVTLRHFRGVVAAEAVIGLLIILVVPFLSGSARKQEFERNAADLTQSKVVGGQEVRLRPSGAQPGPTDYDVWMPGVESGRVAVAFSSPGLGVPPTDVVATSLGGDHYRVSGLYTPMVGQWRARVLTGGAAAASFPLAVTARYEEPESPPPPAVRGSTWAWGVAEVLAVLLALIGAGFASTWITRWRRRRRSPGSVDPAPVGAAGEG
jgi:putative copper export protein